jgi:hypothetical protein
MPFSSSPHALQSEVLRVDRCGGTEEARILAHRGPLKRSVAIDSPHLAEIIPGIGGSTTFRKEHS